MMMSPSAAVDFYRISSSDQSSTRISEVPVLFYGKVREDWIIKQPISLKLERDEDDTYIISEEVFNIYGQGRSLNEAREDFTVALVEYYEILKKYAKDDPASREALEKFTQLWLPPA